MPRPTLPREYRACRASQSRSIARRLRLTISRPRTPLIGSIPTEAGMSAGHKRNCERPHSASTLATRSSFPPVTVMGRRIVLVCRVPYSPKRAGPTPHKIPLTNLCNRLVVNEHPWDPLIRERLALTSLTALSIAALYPARPCWGRNSETPGRRRVARRHSRPRVTRQLVPLAPAVTDRCSSPEGRLRFFSGGVNPRVGVLFRCVGRTVRSLTLHVAPPVTRALSRSWL